MDARIPARRPSPGIAAENHSADHTRLAEFRTLLRDRMRRSRLMDAPRFARNVETAHRTMWRRWREA
jgi:predicted O-linked N-acetylglucosamine transferase (SPINDLY family)